MASLEQMIGTDENAYRVPEKLQQSKGGRKPLGDLTNSSKPRGKDKSSAKPINGFKVQQKVLTSTKTGRKPLRDLSNSNKPQEKKSTKKYSTENLSVVSEEEQVDNWDFHEGFLHDHSECIEAEKQLEMDYFLKSIGFMGDSSSSVFTPELPKLSTETEWELESEMDWNPYDDFSPTPPRERMEAPPTPRERMSCPPTPYVFSPDSPCWIMDSKNLELSLLELKDSPPRN